jgi:hypothetical protein
VKHFPEPITLEVRLFQLQQALQRGYGKTVESLAVCFLQFTDVLLKVIIMAADVLS